MKRLLTVLCILSLLAALTSNLSIAASLDGKAYYLSDDQESKSIRCVDLATGKDSLLCPFNFSLTFNEGTLTISTDGQDLAFAAYNDRTSWEQSYVFTLSTSAGSTPKRLQAGCSPCYLRQPSTNRLGLAVFSRGVLSVEGTPYFKHLDSMMMIAPFPDNNRFAMTQDVRLKRGEKCWIAIGDLAKSKITKKYTIPSDNCGISVCPDGKELLYTIASDNGFEVTGFGVVILNLVTGAKKKLPIPTDQFAAWQSPDIILYTTYKDAGTSTPVYLNAYSLKTGRSRKITRLKDHIGGLAFHE